MRILFAGSPEIAVPALRLLAERHEIVGVLSNPETEQGRGRIVSATPVALAAAGLPGGPVPVLPFERLGAEARDAVSGLHPDLLVSFAYGKIFGPRFLALFPMGGLNVHPSLLPRYRGPAPIPAAILARDAETGVSVQRLALEMDSGELYAVARIPLGGRETTAGLSATAAQVGARLLADVVDAIAEGRAVSVPQTGEASYCTMIAKSDGLIDWNMSCLDIDARIRAYDPWPVAHTYLRGKKLDLLESVPWPDGVELLSPGVSSPVSSPGVSSPVSSAGTIVGLDKSRGLMVQTKDGLVALTRLRFSTRKALTYKEFANGVRDLAGAVLGGGLEDSLSK
ncbi:MAG: methionyl-tRNA formyltransferase [Rectinemataceae bacterium]